MMNLGEVGVRIFMFFLHRSGTVGCFGRSLFSDAILIGILNYVVL